MAGLKKVFSTIRICIVGLFAMVIVACDSDGDALQLSNLVAIADADFTSVEIIGDTDTVIEVGGTSNLSLLAFTEDDQTGTTINTALWSSSDSSIASVTSDGTVTGGGTDGEVDITASFGNLTASRSVRVSSAVLSSIEISSVADVIDGCSAMQFTAVGIFAGEEDQPRSLTNIVDWTVDSESASFLDSEFGLLRVTSGGALQVTATSVDITGSGADVSSTTGVTVLSNLLAIEIEADAGELAVGSPLQFRAFPTYAPDENGLVPEETEITGNVLWSLQDSATSGAFASVETNLPDSGLVTASRAGDGTLTASCAGVDQQINVVAVGSGILASLEIVPVNPLREFPLTVQFTDSTGPEVFVAQALFADQPGFLDVTDEADWTLEAITGTPFELDDNILTINGIGTAMITATFTDENNDDVILSDTVQVTVE